MYSLFIVWSFILTDTKTGACYESYVTRIHSFTTFEDNLTMTYYDQENAQGT